MKDLHGAVGGILLILCSAVDGFTVRTHHSATLQSVSFSPKGARHGATHLFDAPDSVEATTSQPSSTPDFHFATTTADAPATAINGDNAPVQTRTLGSQELLMLPRQYSISPDTFPQMNHVSAVVLSSTPNLDVLKQAIDEAIQSHPLLRCHVAGDGEPEKRIDLFKMVRSGEPDLETFVCPPPSSPTTFTAEDVLSVIDVPSSDTTSLYKSWQSSFNKNLDDGSWCNTDTGPLYKIELHSLTGAESGGEDSPCALMMAFNHAISDQASVNLLTDQIISNMAMIEEGQMPSNPAVTADLPVSMEDSVLGMNQRWADVKTGGLSLDTVKYVAGKAAEGLKSPVLLPDTEAKEGGGGILGALTIISGKAPGGAEEDGGERKSVVQFRKLTEEATTQLLTKCRENGVSMTAALSAAVALTSTDFIDGGVKKDGKQRNYKVLQSLDMRRFGEKLDKCETVACMAGSMDLMMGPLPDRSGEALRSGDGTAMDQFWKLAKSSKSQTAKFFKSDGPKHATRVFDFAMTISDMNNLVHLTAQSKDSQGRAYSAGISNVGVYERQKAVRRNNDGDGDRSTIEVKHGRYEVQDLYFATSHARTGCLYQASCMTVNGEMKCTFHPASPIVSDETNAEYADAFMDLLETVAGAKEPFPSTEISESASSGSEGGFLAANALTFAATALGVGGITLHANAWTQFFDNIMQMKSLVDPTDFWAAVNFWIFFAVGHPILQPILFLSDVLHGSPGPLVADLVPVSFLLGNLAVIAVVATSKQVRNAVNIAALSAFLTYVGAGLDGQAGLGDFNLQLNDSYNGKIVRGCPTYDDVRQPSMDDFNVNKYQGLWYEQKFHDWTQFKEVYDTTLDIKLTPDGKGWKDDFAVKGPAPDAAPLSWDKSPVANGAHYFLFGRIDEKDPPGVLRESGFGVEFPNYIVDAQKDPETGEYTESIQFQCLERGGVRVFEGINFLSRKPQMSNEELAAMHSRAEKAGMYPYGASPEQMHTVARRGIGEPDVDNAWQAMWRSIGFDKMMELLTESIEDGSR